jgi:SAM-dependent methyltransferase
VSSIYSDGTYLERNPSWHAEDAAWKAEQIMAMLRRHGLAPRSVGEIGCGSGELLVHLSESLGIGVDLHGYDVAFDAYQIARPKSRRNLVFHHGDGIEDSAADFDLVLVVDVLEHVEDYIGFARRVAKLGTDKLFHIPLEVSVQTVLRTEPLRASRERFGHLHYFTEETACATIEAAGMTIVDAAFTFTSLDLPAERWRRRVARWPRRVGYAVAPHLAVRVLGGASLLVLAR